MAFSSFGNLGNAMGSGSAGSSPMTKGPDLGVIQTEGLGFLSLSGEAKIRLTSQWSPAPAANASLLSIAPKRGLVAAAGPDGVVLSTTEAVRKAFQGSKEGDSEVRTFQPASKLPLPTRICQLAFTADENYLILSAEQGGGLAVYEVAALLQGSTQSAFQVPTNSEALRALVPNPRPEKGELCAVVTEKGNLLMANMKERDFVKGMDGTPVLKTQVSCVAWSNKGKQLVAGSGDGSITQMTPEGQIKAEIPRPAGLDASFFVSFLMWLENDVFLTVHVSAAQQPPSSQYHLITRQGQNFGYQRLTDPVDPFGSSKTPHHTAARLKDYPPNLQDLLIFSSTATPDIGLLTRSKTALSADLPADKFSNVFTTTELADDSKRAILPMGDGMDSPVPIGTSLDLSSKAPVYKPIPADEIEQSPGPLPGYWVLNDEGVLSVWWIIYNEGIRQGTTYPGLAVVEGDAQPSTSAAAPAAQLTFGATQSASAFGAPSQPLAAQPSAFASPAPAAAAFGGASTLGLNKSPWGARPPSAGLTSPAFGSSAFGGGAASSAPKFGQSSFGSSAFGQASAPGGQKSPWASGSTAATSAPPFGQSGFASAASTGTGVFGSSTTLAGSSGGFANFANSGGFGALGSNETNGGTSIFATNKTGGADTSMDTDTNTSFSSKAAANTSGPFSGQAFKLTSSFQRDPNAKDDDSAPGDGKSLFGSGFASAIGETTKPSTTGLFAQAPAPESTTPTSTPAPNKFFSQPTTAASSGGLFSYAPKDTTISSGSSSIFGKPAAPTSPFSGIPPIKVESEGPKPAKDVADVPLPPESTSKASYPFGSSSSSSATSTDSPDPRKTLSGSSAPRAPQPAQPKPEEKALPADSPPAALEDAPLPPDPLRNKKAYDVKFAPIPGQSAAEKPNPFAQANKPSPTPALGANQPPQVSNVDKATDSKLPALPKEAAEEDFAPDATADAPLPPDPVSNKKVYDVKFAPIPGAKVIAPTQQPTAKPVSIFQQTGPKPTSLFKFPTNPPPVSDTDDDDDLEDDEDDEDETGEVEDEDNEERQDEGASEGSGVDVAKDLSPVSTARDKTPGFTPQSSFGGLGGSFSNVARPDGERRSLFGEMSRNAPVFPQPQAVSPRSPSPVRSAVPSRLAASEAQRSFSAPGMASQILGASRRPQSRVGPPITGRDAHDDDPRLEMQRQVRARKEAEETKLLIDEEDERVQKELRAPIEPSFVLHEFISHPGQVPPALDTIPAQVEAVHKDINTMIDNLGLNARSLTSFIKGHAEAFRHPRRDKNDLSAPDDWTVGELDGLNDIVSQDLIDELEDARITDVAEKVSECQEVLRELGRARNKRSDLQKVIDSKTDPDQALVARSMPLTAEQAAQQNDLRRDFAKFTKLLTETEEGLTVLKAKIVAAQSANGKGGPTPTIEAVVRTITKMTSMVEKRSGDVDMLENQMRKLRFNSPAGVGALVPTASRSREGSPFATPNKHQKNKLSSSMVLGPEHQRSVRETTPLRHSTSSIGGGMFAVRTPPQRRKISGFGDLEKKAIKERRGRRTQVLGLLQRSLEKKGPNVWGLDDIE